MHHPLIKDDAVKEIRDENTTANVKTWEALPIMPFRVQLAPAHRFSISATS